MIVSNDISRLAPSEKAALIYTQAHGDVATRLWRAALGSDSDYSNTRSTDSSGSSLDSLLAVLGQKNATAAAYVKTPAPITSLVGSTAAPSSLPGPFAGTLATATGSNASLSAGLGANARFSQVFVTAAARTGMPAAALAAIVDAEAAKSRDGEWKTASRNPRSSAAGLGQFLGGTWQSEAERSGTWLHDTAVSNGWLGSNGRVLASARSALLALRYDASASINATADYASRSVAQLKQAGVAVGQDVTAVARIAYLGHHLGTADAVKFLTRGLDSGRAKRLLDAQVGNVAADHRIAQASDAASAHRSWLLDFVNRRVVPSRFSDSSPSILIQ